MQIKTAIRHVFILYPALSIQLGNITCLAGIARSLAEISPGIFVCHNNLLSLCINHSTNRRATDIYDHAAISAIETMGYRIAGFSVNVDAGATLSRRKILARLSTVKTGDIIIAHMNKPTSDSAEALRDALPLLMRREVQFVALRGRAVETLAATGLSN